MVIINRMYVWHFVLSAILISEVLSMAYITASHRFTCHSHVNPHFVEFLIVLLF